MSEKPIIVVTGATGQQGGAVVRALLKAGKYAVRAVTRKVESEAAKALAALGAEVVFANYDEKETLTKVFAGAYGAFLLTNYWEFFNVEREIQQGKNLGNAAKEAGLKHVVWSTLESAKELVGEKMQKIGDWVVPHFDGKGIVTEYFKSIGLPITELYASCYFENFSGMMLPRKGEDGEHHIYINMGTTPMYSISLADIGRVVAGILEHPESVGQKVLAAADVIPVSEYAASFTRVLGKPVHYHAIPTQAMASFGFPGAADLANMFEFYRDFPELSTRDIQGTKKYVPDAQTFEQWVAANKAAFATL